MENLLHIGNLDYSMTEEEIEEFFSQYGEVEEIGIVRSRGIGFVRMSSKAEAESAKKFFENKDYLYKGGYLDFSKIISKNTGN